MAKPIENYYANYDGLDVLLVKVEVVCSLQCSKNYCMIRAVHRSF